jgi:hypothetical protein
LKRENCELTNVSFSNRFLGEVTCLAVVVSSKDGRTGQKFHFKEEYSYSKTQIFKLAFFTFGRLGTMWATLVALSLTIVIANAQSQFISPGKNIEVVGVPPIPASVVREVQPYTSIYVLPLAGWDEAKREIRLKGLSSAAWISRVKSPAPCQKFHRSWYFTLMKEA